MKSTIGFWIPVTMLTLSSMVLITNCTKDEGDSKGAVIPIVTTHEVTDITEKTATSGGEISSDGGSTVTERGVCWSTSQIPTIADQKTNDGTGAGSFTSNITSLTGDTTYYVRAYATNSAGTGYGSTMSFKTPGGVLFNPNITYGTMADIDGNTYKTVTIGLIPSVAQTWMAENLKVTKYNDGTNIPNVTDDEAWGNLTTGAVCDYDNTPAKSEIYGKLYNWYAVNTGRLCPDGWHVPADAEWNALANSAGGENIAGGKLKETGTTHWDSPNTGATNETGFTALPGGFRNFYGEFSEMGDFGSWWSAEEVSAYSAFVSIISHDLSILSRFNNFKNLGLSVRCVKDK